MCQFAEAVVSTSEEKKAPPCMERLQKEHCTWVGKVHEYEEVVVEAKGRWDAQNPKQERSKN